MATQHQLFNSAGTLLGTVKTEQARPLLIEWESKFYVLDQGRYVQASPHMGVTVAQVATK